MAANEPETKLDQRFSSPNATPTDWAVGRKRIEAAELFWLSTVRPEGRPHVTPLISVWLDDAAYFCTGAQERKAKNLAQNAHCTLTTGCNLLEEGLDVVIEGEAERVSEDAKLGRIAAAYESKYGSTWHFDVNDGAFQTRGRRGTRVRGHPGNGLWVQKGQVQPNPVALRLTQAPSAFGAAATASEAGDAPNSAREVAM